jgi:hypothetical protein
MLDLGLVHPFALKHNGSVNLLLNLTIIQVLYTKTIYVYNFIHIYYNFYTYI